MAKPETGHDVSRVLDLESYFERLAGLHRRLCPRQMLGVRMGIHAGELLGTDPRSDDRQLLVIVETDGCFADGVSVATGCWLGRRTLRLVDYGKVAVTAIDVCTERAVRLRPHPLARTRAAIYAPSAPNRWHSQLIGYQRMPITELVCAESVRTLTPIAALIGQAGQRIDCDVVARRYSISGRSRWAPGACAVAALASRTTSTPARPRSYERRISPSS